MRNEKTHPSYAVVSFSRVTGKSGPLFGSSVDNQSFIELKISRAEVIPTEYDHMRESIYPDEELIEIHLSMAQFATLITTMNCGFGVPATIHSLNRQVVEPPPHVDKRTALVSSFGEKICRTFEKVKNHVKSAASIIKDKKDLKKADKETIASDLYFIDMELDKNVPFIYKMFNEEMEKIISEAKGEIDAQMAATIFKLGLDEFKKELTQKQLKDK